MPRPMVRDASSSSGAVGRASGSSGFPLPSTTGMIETIS